MNNRRVLITGLGVVSPAGCDLNSFWNVVKNGESKITEISKFDTSEFEHKVAGEVKDFKVNSYGFPFMLTRQLDIFTHYALVASKLTIEDAGLDLETANKNKIGIFLGNCLGGVKFGETELYNMYCKGVDEVSQFQAISWFYTAPQGQISIYYKLKGFSKTFVADKISSDIALGYAAKAIKLNRIEACLTGGTEAGVSPYGYLGFMKSGDFTGRNSEPATAYRPYSIDSNGLVMGEGCGMLLLEEMEHALNRNAPVYGEIAGFHTNCDGVHHKNAANDGALFKAAIEKCLEDAEMSIDDIDYINLDGAAQVSRDEIEIKVLNDIFGSRLNDIALSCPKVTFGHTYGAAGAFDAITNCLVMKNNIVPPTINVKYKNPECTFDLTENVAKEKQVESTLQISRGRGGINSALIIKKFKK